MDVVVYHVAATAHYVAATVHNVYWAALTIFNVDRHQFPSKFHATYARQPLSYKMWAMHVLYNCYKKWLSLCYHGSRFAATFVHVVG